MRRQCLVCFSSEASGERDVQLPPLTLLLESMAWRLHSTNDSNQDEHFGQSDIASVVYPQRFATPAPWLYLVQQTALAIGGEMLLELWALLRRIYL
ncbi:hypothetical protein MSG28_011243 [Choristoneura fumiferana]|uniref:Uncharacterized protein n=1 Tax=Choristoneura fumiferana TaxID=7141 RepID=A0ACC0KRF1_CHOFU|nr:hypothetical protein MSG28_011243 [Choristoneura fumiferana]